MLTTQKEIANLIVKVALHDKAAFNQLYLHTSPKMFGVLISILKEKAEAEDALQDIYIKIWQRADKYAPSRASPMSWLISIARNHAIDCLRANKRRRDRLNLVELEPEVVPTPESNTILSAECKRLNNCLAQLDANRASAVRSAYLEGYSYKELAVRHDVPLNTMRTWLRRSLIQLRKCLET